MEPSKNIATKICEKNDVLLNRVCNSILYISSTKIMKKFLVTEEQVITNLLPCLRLLVGGGEPFRMVYAADLRIAYSHIRLSILKNNFFQRIRGILTMRSDPLINNNEGDQSHIIKRPAPGCVVDLLLSICMFLAASDTNTTVHPTFGPRTGILEKMPDRLCSFATELLTVPMVTILLSEEGISRSCPDVYRFDFTGTFVSAIVFFNIIASNFLFKLYNLNRIYTS